MNVHAIVAWTLYDFANSSFAAVIFATIYAAYYALAVVGNADGSGDLWWGRVVSLSARRAALRAGERLRGRLPGQRRALRGVRAARVHRAAPAAARPPVGGQGGARGRGGGAGHRAQDPRDARPPALPRRVLRLRGRRQHRHRVLRDLRGANARLLDGAADRTLHRGAGLGPPGRAGVGVAHGPARVA